MKKIILIFLCVLMLAGCGKRQSEPLASGISFDAAVSYGKYDCRCNIELSGGGVFFSKITEPSTIAGTEILYDGENVTITFMGLSMSPELPLPNETLDGILSAILQSVSSGGKTATQTDDGFIIENKIAGYDYILTLTESGLPLSLSVPRSDFTAEFSNVVIKK